MATTLTGELNFTQVDDVQVNKIYLVAQVTVTDGDASLLTAAALVGFDDAVGTTYLSPDVTVDIEANHSTVVNIYAQFGTAPTEGTYYVKVTYNGTEYYLGAADGDELLSNTTGAGYITIAPGLSAVFTRLSSNTDVLASSTFSPSTSSGSPTAIYMYPNATGSNIFQVDIVGGNRNGALESEAGYDVTLKTDSGTADLMQIAFSSYNASTDTETWIASVVNAATEEITGQLFQIIVQDPVSFRIQNYYFRGYEYSNPSFTVELGTNSLPAARAGDSNGQRVWTLDANGDDGVFFTVEKLNSTGDTVAVIGSGADLAATYTNSAHFNSITVDTGVASLTGKTASFPFTSAGTPHIYPEIATLVFTEHSHTFNLLQTYASGTLDWGINGTSPSSGNFSSVTVTDWSQLGFFQQVAISNVVANGLGANTNEYLRTQFEQNAQITVSFQFGLGGTDELTASFANATVNGTSFPDTTGSSGAGSTIVMDVSGTITSSLLLTNMTTGAGTDFDFGTLTLTDSLDTLSDGITPYADTQAVWNYPIVYEDMEILLATNGTAAYMNPGATTGSSSLRYTASGQFLENKTGYYAMNFFEADLDSVFVDLIADFQVVIAGGKSGALGVSYAVVGGNAITNSIINMSGAALQVADAISNTVQGGAASQLAFQDALGNKIYISSTVAPLPDQLSGGAVFTAAFADADYYSSNGFTKPANNSVYVDWIQAPFLSIAGGSSTAATYDSATGVSYSGDAMSAFDFSADPASITVSIGGGSAMLDAAYATSSTKWDFLDTVTAQLHPNNTTTGDSTYAEPTLSPVETANVITAQPTSVSIGVKAGATLFAAQNQNYNLRLTIPTWDVSAYSANVNNVWSSVTVVRDVRPDTFKWVFTSGTLNWINSGNAVDTTASDATLTYNSYNQADDNLTDDIVSTTSTGFAGIVTAGLPVALVNDFVPTASGGGPFYAELADLSSAAADEFTNGVSFQVQANTAVKVYVFGATSTPTGHSYSTAAGNLTTATNNTSGTDTNADILITDPSDGSGVTVVTSSLATYAYDAAAGELSADVVPTLTINSNITTTSQLDSVIIDQQNLTSNASTEYTFWTYYLVAINEFDEMLVFPLQIVALAQADVVTLSRRLLAYDNGASSMRASFPGSLHLEVDVTSVGGGIVGDIDWALYMRQGSTTGTGSLVMQGADMSVAETAAALADLPDLWWVQGTAENAAGGWTGGTGNSAFPSYQLQVSASADQGGPESGNPFQYSAISEWFTCKPTTGDTGLVDTLTVVDTMKSDLKDRDGCPSFRRATTWASSMFGSAANTADNTADTAPAGVTGMTRYTLGITDAATTQQTSITAAGGTSIVSEPEYVVAVAKTWVVGGANYMAFGELTSTAPVS